LLPASDLLNGIDGLGSPDEGLEVFVVLREIAEDGDLEIDDALEDATTNALPGDFGEESLNEVEPE
jgi:hypothetical protein